MAGIGDSLKRVAGAQRPDRSSWFHGFLGAASLNAG
jgi:hypothetical protein